MKITVWNSENVASNWPYALMLAMVFLRSTHLSCSNPLRMQWTVWKRAYSASCISFKALFRLQHIQQQQHINNLFHATLSRIMPSRKHNRCEYQWSRTIRPNRMAILPCNAFWNIATGRLLGRTTQDDSNEIRYSCDFPSSHVGEWER